MNSIIEKLLLWSQDGSVDGQGSIPSAVGSGGLFACCVKLTPQLRVVLRCLIEHRYNFAWTGCQLEILQSWLRVWLVTVKQ
jgi:hypothetical protein